MRKALSLVEVMVSVAILVVGLTSILASYANTFILADLARNTSLATNAIRSRIEELKDISFDNLDSFNGTTFNLNGFDDADAQGRIDVSDINSYPDLKEIRVVASFRSRGRVVGEDQNLNGNLDINAGEDLNNNGILDSPVEIVTLIAK